MMTTTTTSPLTIRPDFYASCCRTAINLNGKRCPICRSNLPYRTTADQLRLGDRIRVIDGGAYNVATVLNILSDGDVKVIRPYVHTSDTVYSQGLISYLGFEEFTIGRGTSVIVLEESDNAEVRKQETDEGRRLRAAR